MRRALAGLALLLPGAAQIAQGRSLPGLTRLLPAAAAGALCILVLRTPMPSEVGVLLVRAVLALGLASLAFLYASSLRDAFRRLRAAGGLK